MSPSPEPATPPSAADPDTAVVCYVHVAGQDKPLARGELRRLVVQGRMHPDTPLRAADGSRWEKAHELLARLMPEHDDAQSPAVRPPPVRRRGQRHGSWLGVAIVLALFAIFAVLAWLKGP